MVTARQKKDTTDEKVVAPEQPNIEGNNPKYDDEGNVVREDKDRNNLVKVKDVGLVPDYQANNIPSVGNDGPYLDEIQAREYREYQDLREKQTDDQVKHLKDAVENADDEKELRSTETDQEKMRRLRAEKREKQTVEVLQTIKNQKEAQDNDGNDSGAGTK